MRKLLLTTALALPLTVGSVFAQDATAPADGSATEATTTDMTTTADPAANSDAAPAEGEGDAEAAAMQAEMANSDMVAQEQAPNELRLDWITGASVTSPDGDAIGDINDLIVDGETGQMIAAVIGVGGFLGIGEKQIALPWDQLTINYDAQEITSNLTKEQADAAPEYVFREQEGAPVAETAGTEGTMAQPAGGATETAPADTMAPAGGSPAADAPTGTAPMEGTTAEPMGEPMGDTEAAPAGDMPAEGETAPAN